MKEDPKITKALKDNATLDAGSLTPSRVQKVMSKNGKKTLVTIDPKVVKVVTFFRRVRKSLKLSQAQFASLLGVPLSTYRNYEQYLTPPPATVIKLVKIAKKDPSLIPS